MPNIWIEDNEWNKLRVCLLKSISINFPTVLNISRAWLHKPKYLTRYIDGTLQAVVVKLPTVKSLQILLCSFEELRSMTRVWQKMVFRTVAGPVNLIISIVVNNHIVDCTGCLIVFGDRVHMYLSIANSWGAIYECLLFQPTPPAIIQTVVVCKANVLCGIVKHWYY